MLGVEKVGKTGLKALFTNYIFTEIDYGKPALLISGVVLYLLAPKISRSTIFYYLCAIILGQCVGLLLTAYFINRLVTLPEVGIRNLAILY